MERPTANDPRIARLLGNMQQGQVAEFAHMARNALNGGELAPGMAGRFDQPRHQTGCHRLLNMVPLPCGGITKRPGFEHMGFSGNTDPEQPARLVPFIFSYAESRILEFYASRDGKDVSSPKDGESEAGRGTDMAVWTTDGKCLGKQLHLPWKPETVAEMTFCQSADVIYFAHANLKPGKISRYGDTDWRMEYIKWTPTIQSPLITYIEGIGEWPDGGKENQTYTYVATAIDAETGEESLPSPEHSIVTTYLSSTWNTRLTVSAVEGASEYHIYKKGAGVFGYIGRIIAPNNEFVDDNIGPDTEDTPPNFRDNFNRAGEYPSIVFLHQQRLGYAASSRRPLTVWLSQAGNYESMASSIPPDDDDAIEATLAAPQANRILWAQPDRTGLAIGTEGSEWLLTASDGAALSPKDLSFQPQTNNGSQPGLNPLPAGNGILFVQRGGQVIRELGYSYQDDRYNSTDLSLLARHLLSGNPCLSWTWQPEPYGIAWLCLADGTMAGLTYLREHDVVGWHRHQTNGQVENLACIPAEDGTWQLWLLVTRNGSRRVERMAVWYEGQGSPNHLDGQEKYEFEARCIPCLPETNLQTGATFLRIKKINAISAMVLNSKPFKGRVIDARGGQSELIRIPPRATRADDQTVQGEAIWPCPIAGGWREGSKIELVLDGPGPATLLGLLITLEFAPFSGGA